MTRCRYSQTKKPPTEFGIPILGISISLIPHINFLQSQVSACACLCVRWIDKHVDDSAVAEDIFPSPQRARGDNEMCLHVSAAGERRTWTWTCLSSVLVDCSPCSDISITALVLRASAIVWRDDDLLFRLEVVGKLCVWQFWAVRVRISSVYFADGMFETWVVMLRFKSGAFFVRC